MSCQFCPICSPLSHSLPPLLEESKQEEILCSYCTASPASILFTGKPSCFPCRIKILTQPKQVKSPRRKDLNTISHVKNPSVSTKSPRRKDLDTTSQGNNSNSSIKSFDRIQPMESSLQLRSQPGINLKKPKPDHTPSKSQFKGLEKQIGFEKTSFLAIFLESLNKKGITLMRDSAILKMEEGTFSSSKFHEICDSVDNLVVLIVFSSGFILGAYQEVRLSISSCPKLTQDDKAVLFSVFGGDKCFFYEINSHKVIYEASGPCYGVPINLYLNLDMIDESSCGIELMYKSALGGDVTFKIAENAVWSLLIKEVLCFKLD